MDDLLKYAIEHDMIDLLDVKEQVSMNKKKEILKKYGGCIWFNDKENVWYCYLPDETIPAGRKRYKRRKRDDIENLVFNYYMSSEEQEKKKSMTFSELFYEFMEHKKSQVKDGTIRRMMVDYNKFYAGREIAEMPFIKIGKINIDDFLNDIAETYHPKDKNFHNICGILKQTLEYAVDADYMDKSPYRISKVNKKNIVPTRKKTNNREIFSVSEQALLEKEIYRRIRMDQNYLIPWIVLLDFELGTRIGEILALRKTDITDQKIHIERQVTEEYDVSNLDRISRNGWNIVSYTKSHCGDRWIPLTGRASECIGNVVEINRKLDREYEDYLFITKDNFISLYAVDRFLDRACEHAGIPKRRSHSIRKTYASRLYDSGVAISDISALLGHADEQTTLKHYIFSLDDTEERDKKVRTALELQKNTPVLSGNGRGTKWDQKIISFPSGKNPGSRINAGKNSSSGKWR